MEQENTKETETKPFNAIEDLTLSETETANIKGGPASDYLLQLDGIKGESSDRPTR